MLPQRIRPLEIVAVLAAAATLRCTLLTDLGGLTSGDDAGTSFDAGEGDASGPRVLPNGDVELTDDDAADFGAGTHEGTATLGQLVALAAAGPGRFVSRVHDAGREVAFVSLSWTPGRPYGKPLPDKAGAERGYAKGAFDMKENVLLFHFDGPPGAISGSVVDASGGDNHGEVKTAAAQVADGAVGGALRDDLGGWVAVPVKAASGLNFGVSDVTWVYWVRSSQECPPVNPPNGNRVHVGYDESTGDQTHLWLGCGSTAGSECANPDGTGRAAGTWCSRKSPSSDCKAFCGRTPINDGKWHHIAVVKRGHSQGTLRVFVDGRPDAPDTPTAFATPIGVEPGIELGVGGFSRGTFPAAGDFDEIAVWRRALDDDEVRTVYLRGALGLSLRVRVCKKPDCADAAPFVGPPGSVAFVDPPGGLDPPPPADLGSLPRGRYVQYEAQLASRAQGESPELIAVTIRARP